MGQIRARGEEEKAGRRKQILDAAAGLWRGTPYDAFSMSALAAASGLAKGTLYLYFSTKETLFLALIEARMIAWLERLQKGLARLKDAGSRQVAAVVRETLVDKDPLLDRGLPLLDRVLLPGVDARTATEFLLRIQPAMENTASALEAALPDLEEGDGSAALLLIRALHAGYRPMAELPPATKKAIGKQAATARLADYPGDFEDALANALRGMTRKKGKKK